MSLDALFELFYPPTCSSCGDVLHATSAFCADCALLIEPLPPGCESCSEPGEFDVCPRCERSPPPFTRAWAPFVHGGPVAHAVHLFKYEDRPELARSLARLVVTHSESFLFEAPEHIAAIPLHRGRFIRRRYDQAELLAGEIARLTGRPRLTDALTRTRATARQVGLPERDREKNVRGAFAAHDRVRGMRILLIDDVFTTGATARAAASVLRAAGAAEVMVLSVARAWTS